ncbi:MAG: TlpA family protein disulfide reductase [Bradymonadales bacterium]|nr:TlpA family protein disulfide reductase [Bradymonadales bacterium]
MGKYTTHIALALLVGLIVYSAWDSSQQRQREQFGVGETAVGFSIPAMDPDRGGGPQDHLGKVVVLDFWSTYCPPCRRAMPMFQRLFAHYRPEDFHLFSINVNPDEGRESRRELVARFRDDFRLSFPMYLDTGEASRAYGVDSIPHVVVIDRQGIVRHMHIAEVSERELTAEIDALIGQPVER